MKKILTIAFCAILVVSGCSANSSMLNKDSLSYLIVYSDSLDSDSELVYLDKEGDVVKSVQVESMGIFDIGINSERKIFLPSSFEFVHHYIDENGLVSEYKAKGPTNFIHFNQEDNIIGINNGLYTIVEYKLGNNTNEIKLKGFARVGIIENSMAFIFSDVIHEDRSVLYIVDMKRNKLKKEVPLRYEAAEDIKIFNNKVLISTQEKLSIVNIDDWSVEYKELSFGESILYNLNHIIIENEFIYITSQDNRVFKLDGELNVIDLFKTKQELFHVRSDGNNFYVLSQLNSEKWEGVIGVYDKNTWELKNKIPLKRMRNMRVQNFLLE
jgi:hypothetical protein